MWQRASGQMNSNDMAPLGGHVVWRVHTRKTPIPKSISGAMAEKHLRPLCESSTLIKIYHIIIVGHKVREVFVITGEFELCSLRNLACELQYIVDSLACAQVGVSNTLSKSWWSRHLIIVAIRELELRTSHNIQQKTPTRLDRKVVNKLK